MLTNPLCVRVGLYNHNKIHDYFDKLDFNELYFSNDPIIATGFLGDMEFWDVKNSKKKGEKELYNRVMEFVKRKLMNCERCKIKTHFLILCKSEFLKHPIYVCEECENLMFQIME